ncbi:DNA cytosine methyltransferase [Streptococcus uberis]|nr:DNA (cytosine-5-)-methyltransferase [Streptococcus uberis]MCK1200976.1 DNA cytosine methyltransferase [Streptococcus uberis]
MQVKISKDYFKNIYNKQRENFYNNFKIDKNNIYIDVDEKKLDMNRDIIEKKVSAISMFSGAGGLDIGAYLAGINVLYTLDFNKDSVDTISSNKIFTESTHSFGDIREVDINSIKEIIANDTHDLLFLIGGPPCQPFSKAGYWVTNDNRDSFNDDRNMIPYYFDVVGELNPDLVLLENVESILHPSNSEIVNYIENRFKDLGFEMITLKLNAADFGVPQKRKRVFFIATKKQIKLELQPTHSDKNSNLKPYSKVIDWIYGIEDNNGEVVTGKWEKELTEIPPGENYIALTEKKGHPNPRFIAGKRYWSSLLKLNPLLPSWTIIASPGHWEGPFHWENRRLTNNECAAIQTFPRDYKFSGSSRSVRKQIGNAVPPLLSYTIFKEVIKSL